MCRLLRKAKLEIAWVSGPIGGDAGTGIDGDQSPGGFRRLDYREKYTVTGRAAIACELINCKARKGYLVRI